MTFDLIANQSKIERAKWLHHLYDQQRDEIAALKLANVSIYAKMETEKALMESSLDNFFLIVNAIVVFLVQVRNLG